MSLCIELRSSRLHESYWMLHAKPEFRPGDFSLCEAEHPTLDQSAAAVGASDSGAAVSFETTCIKLCAATTAAPTLHQLLWRLLKSYCLQLQTALRSLSIS